MSIEHPSSELEKENFAAEEIPAPEEEISLEEAAELRHELQVASAIITVQEARIKVLEAAAFEDPLTKINNVRGFHEKINRRREVVRGPITLMLLDADRFKPINDRLGHAAGDAVLREAANQLKKIAREEDVVARIGGDEFVIAFMDTSEAELRQRFEGQALQFPVPYQGEEILVSLSLGFAEQQKGETIEALMMRADEGMYKAKQARGDAR